MEDCFTLIWLKKDGRKGREHPRKYHVYIGGTNMVGAEYLIAVYIYKGSGI